MFDLAQHQATADTDQETYRNVPQQIKRDSIKRSAYSLMSMRRNYIFASKN